jgi:hypothetical protein
MKFLSLYALTSVTSLASALAIRDPPSHHYGQPSTQSVVGTRIEEIPPQFSSKHKRVRVTYGRYHMKPFNESIMSMGGAPMDMGGKGMEGMDMGKGMSGMDATKGAMGGMANEGGMLDASNQNAPKPCSDCTLKYAKSFLKYLDGSVANINTGAWLHHLTMSVVGPGREDLRCPGGTARIPKDMERMLAFHNDRNDTYFGVTGTDPMGFYLGKDDSMILELMLKNELNTPKDVEYSIEWEYVPGRPEGWGDVRGIWVDVAPCSAMMSDIEPPEGKQKFKISGPEWVSTINGRLLNTVGHMHDGGTAVSITKNGKTVCESQAVYNGNPDYIPSPEAILKGAIEMSHISRYTPCINIGEIKKGDVIGISADYDFDKWKPIRNKVGVESDVMGLAMVFVEVQK